MSSARACQAAEVRRWPRTLLSMLASMKSGSSCSMRFRRLHVPLSTSHTAFESSGSWIGSHVFRIQRSTLCLEDEDVSGRPVDVVILGACHSADFARQHRGLSSAITWTQKERQQLISASSAVGVSQRVRAAQHPAQQPSEAGAAGADTSRQLEFETDGAAADAYHSPTQQR